MIPPFSVAILFRPFGLVVPKYCVTLSGTVKTLGLQIGLQVFHR